MALRNKLQQVDIKTHAMAVLKTHRVQAGHLQKDTFNIPSSDNYRFFFMTCKKSKVCVSPSFPQQALLSDFGTKAPLLHAAAQNCSTPKPELPLKKGSQPQAHGLGPELVDGLQLQTDPNQKHPDLLKIPSNSDNRGSQSPLRTLLEVFISRICKPINI